MRNPSRRRFVLSVVTASSGLAAAQATAQAAAVPETDPVAVGLGYKADGSKVDKAKFATYDPSHTCSGCQLYTGKASDANGPCTLFGGRLVAGKGWCSAWAKKA